MFLSYLILLFIAAIAAKVHGSPWLASAWGTCFLYGMLYYNGVIAEWAFKRSGKVGENG